MALSELGATLATLWVKVGNEGCEVRCEFRLHFLVSPKEDYDE
jgi:hypothetical protein